MFGCPEYVLHVIQIEFSNICFDSEICTSYFRCRSMENNNKIGYTPVLEKNCLIHIHNKHREARAAGGAKQETVAGGKVEAGSATSTIEEVSWTVQATATAPIKP